MKRRDLDEKQLRDLIENQRLQQYKAGEIMQASRNTVRKYCKKYGIKTQRTGPRNGKGHPNWKGGTRIVKGYRYIYTPDHPFATKSRYVSEHRLVMEQKLGRYLHPKEVVHHIDGKSLNNHPDNLVVFGSNGKHLAYELKGNCPKWSPEGKAKVTAVCLENTRKRVANHDQLEHDALGRFLPKNRQT